LYSRDIEVQPQAILTCDLSASAATSPAGTLSTLSAHDGAPSELPGYGSTEQGGLCSLSSPGHGTARLGYLGWLAGVGSLLVALRSRRRVQP